MPAEANATPVYGRLRSKEPTLNQRSAIDLLVAGNDDTRTAEQLGLHRTTISKWRLYDPVFQAALNARRAEVFGAGVARLQALIPKALDVLADELDKADNPNRLKAAVAVLKVAIAANTPAGPTDPDEIIRQRVQKRLAEIQADREADLEKRMSSDEELFSQPRPLPSPEEVAEQVMREVEEAMGR